MNIAFALARRNIRLYLRDPLVIFFSLLAPLILLFLFLAFLRSMMVQNYVQEFPGLTQSQSSGLTTALMFAGLTVMATFTAGTAQLGAFVQDCLLGRFADYLVSPVKRWQLMVGYALSTGIISACVAALISIVGQIWLGLSGQPVMSLWQIAGAVGGIVVSALIFSSISLTCVTFIRSPGAFSAFNTVVGVMIGFLTFSYFPPATLSNSVASVFSCLPFAQAGQLIRMPTVAPMLEKLDPSIRRFNDGRSSMDYLIGARLHVGNHILSAPWIVVILLVLTALLSTLAAWRMRRIIH